MNSLLFDLPQGSNENLTLLYEEDPDLGDDMSQISIYMKSIQSILDEERKLIFNFKDLLNCKIE